MKRRSWLTEFGNPHREPRSRPKPEVKPNPVSKSKPKGGGK